MKQPCPFEGKPHERLRQDEGQSRWSSKRPDYAAPFIRKGKVGDWQNHFSQEQAIRLVEKFRVRSAEADIEKLWPGLLDCVKKKYGICH